MKYAAKYLPQQTRDLAEARETMAKEYYRTPHGACNAYKSKEFFLDEEFGHVYFREGLKKVKAGKFEQLLYGKLFEGTGLTSVKLDGGYSCFEKDGQLVATSYVACSGNMVVEIHEEEASYIFVDSRRHGIPGTDCAFEDKDLLEVLMYDTWAPEAHWRERDIVATSPNSELEEELEAAC